MSDLRELRCTHCRHLLLKENLRGNDFYGKFEIKCNTCERLTEVTFMDIRKLKSRNEALQGGDTE